MSHSASDIVKRGMSLALFAVLLAAQSACEVKESAEEIGQDASGTTSRESTTPAEDPPNFLVIIGDDMGVETLSSYGIGEETAVTPNLDRLAAGGVQFNNFWVQPTCSPTRATLLTGRYGFRTGVLVPGYPREDLVDVAFPDKAADAPLELSYSPRGFIPPGVTPPPPPNFDFSKPPTDGLPPSELTFVQVLKELPQNYATAAVGKWHLADSRNGWLDAPNQAGFDYYSGMLMGEAASHFQWLHVSQGEASVETGYIDERTVKDGSDWVAEQASAGKPWLLWMAMVNPHTPITLPPKRLLKSEQALALNEEDLNPDNTRPYALAMIEAMDTLIGNLLREIPESERGNTYIIFMGDNGSVRWAQPVAPVDPLRSKMSVYEGGVRVPFLVAGPAVARGEQTEALGNSVDLFATILELAGSKATGLPQDRELDSRSLTDVFVDPTSAGPREWIYADTRSFATRQLNFAIRDSQYKLVVNSGKRELFNLEQDPWENSNLMLADLTGPDLNALERLSALADTLHASRSPPLSAAPPNPPSAN